MKCAISNIAWNVEDEPAVGDAMAEVGIGGVEVAPTKIWPDLSAAGASEVAAYRRSWEDRGIAVVAMQALLFGRSNLLLFSGDDSRRETLAYLDGVMRLGALLGARPLVFGSPKNRRAGDLPAAEAHEIAVDFFGAAAEAAVGHGVVLCIEANPTQYECDFVTNTAEAAALVEAVGSPGFGLHLDTGGMVLSGEDVSDVVRLHAGASQHFHASEPFLAPLGAGETPHLEAGRALHAAGYSGWISVEMRSRQDAEPAEEVRRIAGFLEANYDA